MLREHGAGISGSTNRGHQAWQSHTKGSGTIQRRSAGSKTGFAGTAAQCLVAVCASRPNSARLVQTLAIRRKCDRKAGLTSLLDNCDKSDARRINSRSCLCEFSESGIVHRLGQSMHNHCTPLISLSVVYATEQDSYPLDSRMVFYAQRQLHAVDQDLEISCARGV